jgi:serine/threonine protein kinase
VLKRKWAQGSGTEVLPGLSRTVAIKMLTRRAARDGGVRERFRREARLAVKLTSEHVARVLDVGDLPDGEQYIVLEYLKGEDLAVVLALRGPLPIAEAVGYVLQACEALSEAHALGIVHRDIKLSNLFVTQRVDGSSCLKLIDFGLAKAGAAGDGGPDHSLTQGAVVGTPRSMAPEQVQSSRPPDARVDIWALGTVLHELLTGEPPFAGETLQELFAKILFQEPPSVSELRPEVPLDVARVVARCLVKNPDHRLDSVASLARELAPHAPPEAKICIVVATVLGSRRLRLVREPPLAAAPRSIFLAPQGGTEVVMLGAR